MIFQSSKLSNQWTAVIVTATTLAGATIFYGISQFRQDESAKPVRTAPLIRDITALGRVEPEREVVQIAAPLMLSGDRVAELLVQRGDYVRAGQVIAVLDSRDRLQTALLEARKQVKVAQAELAQVRDGAKSGEIAAQRATIYRLQAELQGEILTQTATITRRQSELNNARVEYSRYRFLNRTGAISASQLDSKKLILETAQAQLNEARAGQNRTTNSLQQQISEARATLTKIAEVRPVDVGVVQAKVEQAIAATSQAKANLEQAYVRTPLAGQILEVYAKPGEKVGSDGIAAIGQTSQMEVVAEVYQTDISQVKVGQPATITGEAFSSEMRGTVRLIGQQVTKQKISSDKPGENLDRRVIEVRIRLTPESSRQVANLTNLQVQVAIHLDRGSGELGVSSGDRG